MVVNLRRIIVALVVVGFIAIITVIIFSIDWGGGGRLPEELRQSEITDLANSNVSVRMSQRGEIVNNQEHQEMSITVSANETVGELYSGYQGNVIRSQRTSNNPESFKAFLSALHNADFTKRKPSPRNIQYDGACSEGIRYTFEFIGGEDVPESMWATSCNSQIGTFDGRLGTVTNLFNRQLPNDQYDSLIDDTEF